MWADPHGRGAGPHDGGMPRRTRPRHDGTGRRGERAPRPTQNLLKAWRGTPRSTELGARVLDQTHGVQGRGRAARLLIGGHPTHNDQVTRIVTPPLYFSTSKALRSTYSGLSTPILDVGLQPEPVQSPVCFRISTTHLVAFP